MADTFNILFKNEKPKHFVNIFSFNKKKFMVEIKHYNSTISGFNTNCCLSVMKDDGTFGHIADNRMIGCDYKNLYVLDDTDKRIINVNNKCFNAFKDFIKAVYT